MIDRYFVYLEVDFHSFDIDFDRLNFDFYYLGISITCRIRMHTHVKLMSVINSCRGFSKGLYCMVDTSRSLGIADLDCRKVESTKWLKHRLRAALGGQ